jgi:hypothetical protein
VKQIRAVNDEVNEARQELYIRDMVKYIPCATQRCGGSCTVVVAIGGDEADLWWSTILWG